MAEAYVLLGDVVRSRDIADRDEFGVRLSRVCRAVNQRYREEIGADFTLLKGIDEFGAVLTDIARVYDIVRDIADVVRPRMVRFALISDEVDVGLETGDVSAMDGPAFHRADELLETMESNGLRFDMRIGDGPLDRAVADEINLLLRYYDGLTDRQRETIAAYARRGSQTAAADELGVTQQSVSKVIRQADWPMVRTVEERLECTLEEWSE